MAELYKLSKYVLEELRENRIDKNTVVSLIKKFNEREDIAIIGMGMKYANTEKYGDYWELLRNKRTVVERCPKRRIDLIRGHFPGPVVGKEETYCKGSFIQDIEMFDPEVFSMTQEEAAVMNPGHRMMLQAVYRTLEDSGYLGEKNSDNRTGVFIGNNFTKDALFSYSYMALRNSGFNFSFDTMLNNWSSGIATKVANIFDLHGGAYMIDASCPSSTFAIANACQALRNRQCTTAIAGGLLVDMSPIKQYNNSGWIFLHEDDIITRGFDNDPGGAYIAEGAAAVMLKPLAQAIEDGDRIHGIICGHSINNNGANGSFTQSSPEDIKKVVLSAVKNAQVDINDVDYLEGEGYPGKVEEGLELSGLISGFSQLTDRKQFCGLGTISGNVGYLQSAIGVFNLIKVCLAMKHKIIPPQYRFIEPTDMVNLVKSPFYVSDYEKPWLAEDGKPRQSAIYSYGYGGNNLMLFLQEAPEVKEKGKGRKAEVFILSARSKASFTQRIRDMIDYLTDPENQENLTDICYTADVCRPVYRSYRLAVLCRSKEQLAQSLQEYLKNDKAPMNMFVGTLKDESPEKKRKVRRQSVDGLTMEEVATTFCEGADYIFDELFDGVEKSMAELPQYPFDKKYCWLSNERFTLKKQLALMFGKQGKGMPHEKH